MRSSTAASRRRAKGASTPRPAKEPLSAGRINSLDCGADDERARPARIELGQDRGRQTGRRRFGHPAQRSRGPGPAAHSAPPGRRARIVEHHVKGLASDGAEGQVLPAAATGQRFGQGVFPEPADGAGFQRVRSQFPAHRPAQEYQGVERQAPGAQAQPIQDRDQANRFDLDPGLLGNLFDDNLGR